MRVVIALGGNAIARKGEPLDVASQRRRVHEAAGALAEIARDHEVVVTHGNGPQVGLLAVQAQSTPDVPPHPLDVLGAESEGMIGYLIEQEMGTWLPEVEVATLLTQVEVDADDPAFADPRKPIGPVYAEAEAAERARRVGWHVAPVSEGEGEGKGKGEGWRRVVASPEPRRIRELRTIERLLEAGVIVICAGGGGIPVVCGEDGALRGIEAVIDKDRTAALLAEGVGADALLLLTDVDAIYADWPEREEPIREIRAPELRRRTLAAGSMGPKAEAACRFAERSGRPAMIGALDEARQVLAGEAGTRVLPPA